MRRLLFNPLEQEPYTSGEYNNVKHLFYLDKGLKSGYYTYSIIEWDGSGTDTIYNGNIYIEEASGHTYYGNSVDIKLWYTANKGQNRANTSRLDGSFLDDGLAYTIYFYKIY